MSVRYLVVVAVVLLRVTAAYVEPGCPVLKPCVATYNQTDEDSKEEPRLVKRASGLDDIERTALNDPRFRATRINCLSKILEEEANNTETVS